MKSPTLPSPKVSAPKPRASEADHDADLVRRCQAGDEPAFVEIMERYRSKLFTVALGLLRNHADAEEIVQDTFVRAYRGLAKFRGDSSLATWLYRIAVNLARNRYWYFRRRRRQDTLSLECGIGEDGTGEFADLIAGPGPDPAREAATGEFSSLVEHCLAQLDPVHREILTLRNVLNQSYEEIASTLHLNVGTVKSRIARARENLRARLAAECPEFAPDASPGEWFFPESRTHGSLAILSCA